MSDFPPNNLFITTLSCKVPIGKVSLLGLDRKGANPSQLIPNYKLIVIIMLIEKNI